MASVYASFPGIDQIVSVSARKSLGIEPGRAIVEFIPQPTVSTVDGTLTIGVGSEYITWQQAHLDVSSIELTAAGHLCRAMIYDRRFWWTNTFVHGRYNMRDAFGKIISSTEKTPWELATLLLTEMGESGFNVSSLPNSADDRPDIDWSCAIAANELHKLLTERGCDIDVTMGTNQAVVHCLGTGNPIPSDGVRTTSYGVDRVSLPATLRAYTSPTIWEAKFKLQSMAMEVAGGYVPKADASYAPDDWSKETPGHMLPEADENVQMVANSSVYSAFRIQSFANGGMTVPGTEITLSRISQCEWLSYKLEISSDEASGQKRPMGPLLEGIFAPRAKGGVISTENSTEMIPLDAGFDFYPDTGFVVTNRPVFKTKNGGYEDPELYLTVAFRLASSSDNQLLRYTYDMPLDGLGIRTVDASSVTRTIRAVYESDGKTLDSVIDNQSSVDASCLALLNAALVEYQERNALSAEYRGIRAINLDGVTRELWWYVRAPRRGLDGDAWTKASQNCETTPGTVRASQRKLKTKLAVMLREQRKNPNMTRVW